MTATEKPTYLEVLEMERPFIKLEIDDSEQFYWITNETARALIKKAIGLDYSDQYHKHRDAFVSNWIVTVLDKLDISMLLQLATKTETIDEKYHFSRYSLEDKVGFVDCILRRGAYFKAGELGKINFIDIEYIKKLAVKITKIGED